MEPLDDVRALLTETRDLLKDHAAKWEAAYQEGQEKQAEADRLLRRTKRGGWILMAILAVFLIVIYGAPYLTLFVGGTGRSGAPAHLLRMKHFEARYWFQYNLNEAALASNRFGETAKAEDFVERLYKAGAPAVYVTNVRDDPDTQREKGGPYGDALIVVLPNDPAQRAELFRIHAAETKGEGFTPEPDSGQTELFFRWD
ncbi:MAG: hypothetical protein JXR37_06840 [Kiritimatiellae bacterium]|nr:hypothetical protein [Kiritimatiellia bacterium]